MAALLIQVTLQVLNDFTECAGTTPSGKLDLTTLVTAHKDKLTWYKAASGDEKLESTIVDISQPGVYHYYVTNTEPGYTKTESDRVEATVTIKGHIEYSLDKTQISECLQYDSERSFNIQNPTPADATFEWYNGTTLLGSGLKYTLENKEGSGKYTLYKGETEVLSGTSKEGVDITFTDKEFNGIYNGHEMPNDDYWFIITTQEGDVRKQRSGHFRLRR